MQGTQQCLIYLVCCDPPLRLVGFDTHDCVIDTAQIECGRCPWFDASLEAVDAEPEDILDAEASLEDAQLLDIDASCFDLRPDESLTCAPPVVLCAASAPGCAVRLHARETRGTVS